MYDKIWSYFISVSDIDKGGPFDFYDGGGGQGSRFWIYLRLILLFLYYSVPCIFINSRMNYFYLCICYFPHYSCILTFLFKIRFGPGILLLYSFFDPHPPPFPIKIKCLYPKYIQWHDISTIAILIRFTSIIYWYRVLKCSPKNRLWRSIIPLSMTILQWYWWR